MSKLSPFELRKLELLSIDPVRNPSLAVGPLNLIKVGARPVSSVGIGGKPPRVSQALDDAFELGGIGEGASLGELIRTAKRPVIVRRPRAARSTNNVPMVSRSVVVRPIKQAIEEQEVTSALLELRHAFHNHSNMLAIPALVADDYAPSGIGDGIKLVVVYVIDPELDIGEEACLFSVNGLDENGIVLRERRAGDDKVGPLNKLVERVRRRGYRGSSDDDNIIVLTGRLSRDLIIVLEEPCKRKGPCKSQDEKGYGKQSMTTPSPMRPLFTMLHRSRPHRLTLNRNHGASRQPSR